MTRRTPPDRPARDLPGRRARPGLLGEWLSPDEKREAAQNLATLFRLLDAWDRAGAATRPAATPPTLVAKVAAKVACRGPRARGRAK